METKICLFCQNPTAYVPLIINTIGTRKRTIHLYSCNPCNTTYSYGLLHKKLENIHLYTSLNQQIFRYTINPITNKHYLYAFQNEPYKTNGYNKATLIKYFEDLQPKVNPNNLQEYLSLWLPFL